MSSAADSRDCIAARRNVLVALWAGRLLGLSDEDLTAYAHNPRLLCVREARLAYTIENDLRRGGVVISRDEIQAALIRFHRVALHQACSTD